MATVAHEQETMPREDSIKARYEAVRARIEAAASRVGRKASGIVLVAVTKNASIDQIRELLRLGHVDYGENRAQVLAQHAAQLEEFLQRNREMRSTRDRRIPDKVRWHMIGHLQRNKVRKVVELVRLVHSVDSLRLAEELQAVAAGRGGEPLEILIQVNVTGERGRSGIAPAAVRHLIDQIDTMFHLKVRGLMCMSSAPPPDAPPDTASTADVQSTARSVFERCRELYEELHRSGVAGERFDILSMGMTSDFETAIECGANIVRVGGAIFGEESQQADREQE